MNKGWLSHFWFLTHWTVSQSFFLDMVLWKVVFSRDRPGDSRLTTTQAPQVGNLRSLPVLHVLWLCQLCALHSQSLLLYVASTFFLMPGILFLCRALENSWQAFVTGFSGLQILRYSLFHSNPDLCVPRSCSQRWALIFLLLSAFSFIVLIFMSPMRN